MKNIFTQIYQKNPIADLFRELYFPLKNKVLSESSPSPIPTAITKFFEIIAYHFDQAYKERVLIFSSCFPCNSLDIIEYIKTLVKPDDISNVIYSRFNKDLEKFAEERGLYKLKNESDLQFQSRIINAHRFLATSPTLDGLTNIITNAISNDPKEFTIQYLYDKCWYLGETLLDKNLILENNILSYFIVDFDTTPITLEQKTYLESIINLYKPACIGFYINAFILDS